MSSGLARRNHFLPQFYLRKWTTPESGPGDEREFKLWGHRRIASAGRFHPKRYPTKAVGFQWDSLTVPPEPNRGVFGESDRIEKEFARVVDSPAADALDRISKLEGRPADRHLWLTLIESILTRQTSLGPSRPELEQKLREYLFSAGPKGLPEELGEALALIPTAAGVVDVEVRFEAAVQLNALAHLYPLTWVVLESPVPLLTSDVPFASTNAKDWLSMPLSPNLLLVIGTPPVALHDRAALANWSNRQQVERARRDVDLLVYSRDALNLDEAYP